MLLHGTNRSKVGTYRCRNFRLFASAHALPCVKSLESGDVKKEKKVMCVCTTAKTVLPMQQKETTRLQVRGNNLMKTNRKSQKIRRRELLIALTHHVGRGPVFISPSWFIAPLGLTLPTVSRPDFWRKEFLYRGEVTLKPGPKRALPPRA